MGKTWVMQKFGQTYYRKVAYFNFENAKGLKNEFLKSIQPKQLLPVLSLYCGFEISADDTIIIFDEIQECNDALNSLKYFSEEAPEYNIMAAGSLLGVAMARGGSFPVGKVEFLRMYPVSFNEFLHAADSQVYDYLNSLTSFTVLPEIIYDRLHTHYRRYLICGGMPQSVLTMLETNNLDEVDKVLKGIIHSYGMDFSKHAPNSDVPRISEIWKSIPSQLAKENRKFIYKLVRPGARAREYENALLWLQQAGLIYKVNCCTTPMIPLTAYDDISAFKIYVFDIGILRVMSEVSAEVLLTDNPLFREFRGAYSENAALQALVPQYDSMPRYWVSEGKAEVDFIIQGKTSILPIEVKAAANTSGKSLSVYIGKYHPQKALIVSGNNVSDNGIVLNIPHGGLGWLSSLLQF